MKGKFVRLGVSFARKHGNTLTVRKLERLAVQRFEMRKIKRCEHHNHLNFCVARPWLHECVVTQLGDAILDFT